MVCASRDRRASGAAARAQSGPEEAAAAALVVVAAVAARTEALAGPPLAILAQASAHGTEQHPS